MTPYRHYTDDEIAAANDTDLPELLSSLGYQVQRVGNYYTTKEMDSLRIKGASGSDIQNPSVGTLLGLYDISII